MRTSPCRSTTRCDSRRGNALLLAVILLVMTAALTTTLTRTTLLQYQQSDRSIRATQADCIAESAIVRALQAVHADPSYTGETWEVQVPGSEYGAAKTTITLDGQRIQVDVLFPVDAPVNGQVRLHREVAR